MIVGRNEDLLRATLTAKDMNWISIAPIRAPDARPGEDPQQARRGRRDDLADCSDPREMTPASKSVLTSRSAPSRPARPLCSTTGDLVLGWWVDRIADCRFLWSLAHAPLGLARFYAALLDLAIPRLRRTAMRNLELAYPEKSPAERRAIADEVFRSIARLIWVFARFPQINRQNIHKWIRYEGLEHYLEAKKAGRGILFATAHFGNWELSAFAHALMTEPMHIMIRPLDNPGDRRLVEDRRQLSGNHLIVKWDGARAVCALCIKTKRSGF